jgi:threonine synthase
MMGLATDGGLILPEVIPDVRDRLDDWESLSYPELAFEILSIFVGNCIADADLRTLIKKSYSTFSNREIAPVVTANDLYVMELFHGPTLAFKDIALQFLGNLFEYILSRDRGHLNILGVTSGDTGSAAISGVRGKDNINIFILHPYQRVSPVQERQMTTVLDGNVFNIAIKGSFDDGQRIIKELFNDLSFKDEYHLGAVNSVNWVRVAAQTVYYFYGAFRVTERTGKENVCFCVPTGNFGNIFAGHLARQMGAPISNLILASNENDILTRFITSGVYEKDTVHKTFSPSMDIQVASNFERYLYLLLDHDSSKLCSLMDRFQETGKIEMAMERGSRIDASFLAGKGDDSETLNAIKSCYDKSGYLLDPHTAVGFAVAQKHHLSDQAIICLATAHPAKFGDVVKRALGRDAAHHERIEELERLPTRCEILPATTQAVREFMVKNISN